PAPKPEPKVEAPPKVEPKPVKVEVVKAEPPKKKPADPKPEPADTKPLTPLDFPAPPGRSVRVRLLDGSSIAGTVRAELSESLGIACTRALLSIPRARTAPTAYDAAPGTKRAPVQQLDDDLPPRKR